MQSWLPCSGYKSHADRACVNCPSQYAFTPPPKNSPTNQHCLQPAPGLCVNSSMVLLRCSSDMLPSSFTHLMPTCRRGSARGGGDRQAAAREPHRAVPQYTPSRMHIACQAGSFVQMHSHSATRQGPQCRRPDQPSFNQHMRPPGVTWLTGRVYHMSHMSHLLKPEPDQLQHAGEPTRAAGHHRHLMSEVQPQLNH
jgi:hypothetical protein